MIENNIKNLRRQKIMTVALATLPACMGVLGCHSKGPAGPQGPAGPTGPAGSATGGAGLGSCSDIIAQGTCYTNIPSVGTSYNMSVVCMATGSPSDQAFQICYYKEGTCTVVTGVAGFGYNYLPDTAGGVANIIPDQHGGGYNIAGGPFVKIIATTGSC